MDILGIVEIPNWLLIIGLLLVTLYIYLTWTFDTFQKLGIPGPKPSPLFGTLWPAFKKGIMAFESETAQKYSRCYGSYEMRLPVLVIYDEELIRQVCVKQIHNFTNRRAFEGHLPPMDVMMTILKDDQWKRVRSLVTPAFSTSKLKKMNAELNRCAQILTQNMEEHTVGGKSVELKVYSSAYTMDIIASTAFGLQIDSQKDVDNSFVKMAQKVFQLTAFNPVMLVYFFCPFLMPLIKAMKIGFFPKDVSDFFSDIVNRTMEKRQDENISGHLDFMQLMMNAHKEEGDNLDEEDKEDTKDTEEDTPKSTADKPKKGLTHNEILAQSMLFFLAGYEGTSTTIALLAYNLATNPECQEKLYQEIQKTFKKGENIDHNKMLQMTYLDMCVNESMRIYPPTVRTDRLTKSDTTIEGVSFQKDMLVAIPIWYMHHRPDIWPQPDTFRPERFSAEEKAKRSPYCYMPFGLGGRNCIGSRLALMSVKMAIIYLVQNFQILTSDQTQIPLKFKKSGHLNPENGVWLKMEKRTDE